eukprot:5151854-Pyramimonas_sp.AAC.1
MFQTGKECRAKKYPAVLWRAVGAPGDRPRPHGVTIDPLELPRPSVGTTEVQTKGLVVWGTSCNMKKRSEQLIRDASRREGRR